MSHAKILEALRRAVAELDPNGSLLHNIFTRAQVLLELQGAEYFDEFWALYPTKTAKDVARKSWVRMDGDTYWPAIRKNILWRIRSNDWNPRDLDRRRFIPHASTYLNQRRWTDEMTIERTGAHKDF